MKQKASKTNKNEKETIIKQEQLNEDKLSVKNAKYGKNFVFTIIYWGIVAAILSIIFLFNDKILKIAELLKFVGDIDKNAVVGVVTAFNVCVVSTLTLSLTIDNSNNEYIAGISPKKLNVYIGKPISLLCSFFSLAASLLTMIVLLKIGFGTTFYFFVLCTIIYFLIIVIVAIPVLIGDENIFRFKTSIILNNEEVLNQKQEAFNIVRNMFKNGKTYTQLFNKFKTNSKNFKNLIINLLNILTTVIDSTDDKIIIESNYSDIDNVLFDLVHNNKDDDLILAENVYIIRTDSF